MQDGVAFGEMQAVEGLGNIMADRGDLGRVQGSLLQDGSEADSHQLCQDNRFANKCCPNEVHDVGVAKFCSDAHLMHKALAVV